MTNERLVYGGVTTDLVSMRDQPLHAMPMFKVSPINHRLAASLKISRYGNVSVIAKFRNVTKDRTEQSQIITDDLKTSQDGIVSLNLENVTKDRADQQWHSKRKQLFNNSATFPLYVYTWTWYKMYCYVTI